MSDVRDAGDDPMPHAYAYNGAPVCWCGVDHPKPEGGPIPEDEWIPATSEHLDSLYLEAWLGETP